MRFLVVPLALVLLVTAVAARGEGPASTRVDADGVWRWTADGTEVAQFGVNYTAPFAYSFRAHARLGVPIEQAIDADVYHLARLGLDAYRVHIWDREISDPLGNVVVNAHLRAFDYLLAKLKERHIRIVLTLMQFGDNGYPEGGQVADGFSKRYGKAGCLGDPTSWPLQERYLGQLVRHVNAMTGITYGSDPDILGFEICNEPGHFEYAPTVGYINTMVGAIRATGCAKPIFYNMSHGLPVFQAYLDANVQGGTFQWYPSNLVAGHEQHGNFLPYLDDYPIPFADAPGFRRKARMFYEFDAADIGASYLYPAMARTFRKVGAQFATQFAYDPMYLAAENTEYQTHYLNLAFTPQKALSLMIAGEAFRRVPRFRDYGAYPKNIRFDDVRVSYEEQLSEMVTPEKFFYSNRTATPPPAPAQLAHVAGYDSSAVVNYPGQGAYFLDRVQPGVWRLELMPDAIRVGDPFAKPNPRKPVTVIAWQAWPMRIVLPDLGPDFTVVGVNEGNAFHAAADGGTVTLRPGTYRLTRRGITGKWKRSDRAGNLGANEFVAPRASVDRTYVLHEAAFEAAAGEPLSVDATVVARDGTERVELVAFLPQEPSVVDQRAPVGRIQPGGSPPVKREMRIMPMTHRGNHYTAEVPGNLLAAGTLTYHIAVKDPKGYRSFPADLAGFPTDWDYYGQPWTVPVVEKAAPLPLFVASRDAGAITANGRAEHYDLVPSDRPGLLAMAVRVEGLEQGDHQHSFRYYFRDQLRERAAGLAGARRLVVYGASDSDRSERVQLALVTADGAAFGAVVEIPPRFGPVSVPVEALRPVASPNLPHGYPVFIQSSSSVSNRVPLELSRVESVLVSLGPGIPADQLAGIHGVKIERIWLER